MNENSKKRSVPGADSTGSVQSIDRAIGLLGTLADNEDGLRLTDLAKTTRLSLSTTHRLMTTLQRHGFVQFGMHTNLWHIGSQAFVVGSAFAKHRNFAAHLTPYLRRLRDQTKETANLGVVDRGQLLFLTRVESREIMRAISNVGGRAPLTVSGMGKAMLASYDDDDLSSFLKAEGLKTPTPKSIRTPGELRKQLMAVRELGYAVDDEEYLLGLRCVAAVVYNHCAEPMCAISVSGLARRLTDGRLSALGNLLKETAAEITIAMGGRMPQENA
ncbi:IclR family transcriptional regulator [Devosia sp. A449]